MYIHYTNILSSKKINPRDSNQYYSKKVDWAVKNEICRSRDASNFVGVTDLGKGKERGDGRKKLVIDMLHNGKQTEGIAHSSPVLKHSSRK